MRPKTFAAVSSPSLVLACALFASADQLAAQSQNNVAKGAATPGAPATPNTLPVDLLPVPAGKVQLGSEASQLLDISKALQPRAPKRRVKLLHKLQSYQLKL